MSIFDRLKKLAFPPEAAAPAQPVPQEKVFTFDALPESLEQLQALPQARLDDPFQTAALTVLALCAYGADEAIGTEMLNWLRGQRPLSGHELSFLKDRFRDGVHIPFSYFKGAVPGNDYVPTQPYTITVQAGPYADANPGYKKLHIPSGGADNPREVVLRRKGDGTWLLWEQFLMVGIRQSKSQDPWA